MNESVKLEDKEYDTLLTIVVVLKNSNEEYIKKFDEINNSIMKDFIGTPVNVIPYKAEIEEIIINDQILSVTPSKYVCVINADDNVKFRPTLLDELKNSDSPYYYNYMKRTASGINAISSESELTRFIYNKIIPISRLVDMVKKDTCFIHTDETLYNSLIYRDFTNNFAEYKKTFLVDYETDQRTLSLYNKDIDALTYGYLDENGNEGSVFTTVDILLPMARQYLDVKDYYNLGYSETNHLISIIRSCSLGSPEILNSIKGLYSGNEILNALYIIKDIVEFKDKDFYKDTALKDLEMTPTDLSVDIVIHENQTNLIDSIKENVIIPYNIITLKTGKKLDASQLKNKYVWFVPDEANRVLLTDYTIQPNEADFVFFEYPSETIYDIGDETEQPLSELGKIWIKTETFKNKNVNINEDFITEGRIKTLMKKLYK